MPPLQDAVPPAALLRVANPVVKAVLRSPLHRLMSRSLILVTVTGRKSGREYTLPVGRHQASDGSLFISARGTWRHNIETGRDVRVTLEGRERTAHITVEDDPDKAAGIFAKMIADAGPRAVGVKVDKSHPPTTEDIKALLERRRIAYLNIAD